MDFRTYVNERCPISWRPTMPSSRSARFRFPISLVTTWPCFVLCTFPFQPPYSYIWDTSGTTIKVPTILTLSPGLACSTTSCLRMISMLGDDSQEVKKSTFWASNREGSRLCSLEDEHAANLQICTSPSRSASDSCPGSGHWGRSWALCIWIAAPHPWRVYRTIHIGMHHKAVQDGLRLYEWPYRWCTRVCRWNRCGGLEGGRGCCSCRRKQKILLDLHRLWPRRWTDWGGNTYSGAFSSMKDWTALFKKGAKR